MKNGNRSLNFSRRDLLQLGAGATVAGLITGLADTAEARVETRPIPSSGEALPVIGLGTSRVFDIGQSAAERDPCRKVLEELIGAGASVVDSSPMYRRAEEVSGDLAADLGYTDRIFWATKVWTDGQESGVEQMNESMRLFRTDQIDLMQIHNLRDWEVHIKTLRDWKEQEKIRYIGITHSRTRAFDALEKVIEEAELDFVQLNYSMAEREAEDRLLPLCAEKGIATLINRPFQRGGLFNKVDDSPVPEWASEFGAASWGQFFLKFILANPAVTCVIPATSQPRHMVDNLLSGVGSLPDKKQRQAMIEYLADL